MDKVRRLQKTRGYIRRIVRPHFGCCCPHKRKDQLRRTARDLRKQIAKSIEADGGTFEHLL